MNAARLSFLSTLTLAALGMAQDPFAPAAEMKKLEPLLGTWEGTGTVVPEPGMPEMPWTSKHSYALALNGHFVREDVVIEFGPMMPDPLQMTTYIGWDRENGRYVTCSATNMGMVDVNELHLMGNQMVQVVAGVENGVPTLDRWVTELGDGVQTFEALRCVGSGEPFVHLTGEVKRTSEQPNDIAWADAAFMLQHDISPMQHLEKMAGTYKVAGNMIPAPGAPPMDISATETVAMWFGGTVAHMQTAGDPIEGMPGTYEGVSFIGWNPHKGHFTSFGLSNMGEVHAGKGWWSDQGYVTNFTGMMMGQPAVMQGVVQVDDAGAITGVVMHQAAGGAAPVTAFQAGYTKQ